MREASLGPSFKVLYCVVFQTLLTQEYRHYSSKLPPEMRFWSAMCMLYIFEIEEKVMKRNVMSTLRAKFSKPETFGIETYTETKEKFQKIYLEVYELLKSSGHPLMGCEKKKQVDFEKLSNQEFIQFVKDILGTIAEYHTRQQRLEYNNVLTNEVLKIKQRVFENLLGSSGSKA